MMNLGHPTFVPFVGFSRVDFHNEPNVVLLMEFARNGSLADVIKQNIKGDGPHDYTNTTKQKILIGISRGMKFLHDRNIIHRDLKPANVLLDELFLPMITYFGLSKCFDPNKRPTFGEIFNLLKKKHQNTFFQMLILMISMHILIISQLNHSKMKAKNYIQA